jgi:hypothetical protein
MSYMVDEMPYGGYALGGYALGGEIYGGKGNAETAAKARAAKALKHAVKTKAPAKPKAKKHKKPAHQVKVKVTVAHLKSQAKALGIKGFSKMRKAELVHALKLHDKPRHMVEAEHKPKKHVKRSTKKTAVVNHLTERQCLEILEIGDILKMKLAELKKRVGHVTYN